MSLCHCFTNFVASTNIFNLKHKIRKTVGNKNLNVLGDVVVGIYMHCFL